MFRQAAVRAFLVLLALAGFLVVSLLGLAAGIYLRQLSSTVAALAVLALALALFCRKGRHGRWISTIRTAAPILFALLCLTAFLLAGTVVATSYQWNISLTFFGALIVLAGFCFFLVRLLRGREFLQTSLVTIALLLVAFSLLELLWPLPLPDAPGTQAAKPARQLLEKRFYSYAAAQGDPASFAVWWNRYVHEWNKLEGNVIVRTSTQKPPFRPQPNSSVQFFESEIRFNNLGFRGPEMQADKENRFRIVAIGESTTMGATLRAQDEPWPRVLDRLIREEVEMVKPVQVINAGVSAYTLAHSLERLKSRVLQLEPDLVISYHGYNGFMFIDPSIPTASGTLPPPLPKRPSSRLALLEHRRLMNRYIQSFTQPSMWPEEADMSDEELLTSLYAELYRELIQLTKDRAIPLVLVSFNMSVNGDSPRDVVIFYSAGFPHVRSAMRANRWHNRLIQLLAEQHDHVTFIPSQTGIDGHHEKFIDLVHLTQAGRDQLAKNIFENIRPLLPSSRSRDDSEQ